MQVFARRGFALRAASLETRIAYTVFLALALLGAASMGALSVARIGVTPAAIATYYRGGESEMSFPKQFWQLAEVIHFHLFSISVVLLILSHLLAATPLPARARLGVIGATSAGAFLDLCAPWAVRYLSGAFAWALLAAWLLLGGGMLCMLGVSLVSLWGPERWSNGAPSAERTRAAEGA
jgi:hypothetical protein